MNFFCSISVGKTRVYLSIFEKHNIHITYECKEQEMMFVDTFINNVHKIKRKSALETDYIDSAILIINMILVKRAMIISETVG